MTRSMSRLQSVILCTKDPRPHHMRRTIEGLRTQIAPKDSWELILIDNASHTPVAEFCDLSWHSGARVVQEGTVGLTNARLRGIVEARGEILVFVDDDTVLAPDFLVETARIADAWPTIGAWGGRVRGEYDHNPETWVHRYQSLLTIRELDRDRWSSFPTPGAIPCGAGLCVRRAVGQAYLAALEAQPSRRLLDRRGTLLGSCGDLDLAFCAVDLELGIGRFLALEVVHLIPRSRTTLTYLEKAQEWNAFSEVVLRRARGWTVDRPSRARRMIEYARAMRLPAIDRRMRIAWLRGQQGGLDYRGPH